jgi:transcriptional regulator with GAF, ATPase, and Fis domain
VREAQGGADALAQLESGQWQVLFLDRRLLDLDAEELVSIIKLRFPGIEVVLLDSDSGASPHWITKDAWLPGSNEEVPGIGRGQLEGLGVVQSALPGMIGRSPAMQSLYRKVRLVAPRTTTVLVLGETGTGKELVARAIHGLSPRAHRACVTVNCAAIPEALLESELFGYARGAFTGAVQSYAGRVYAAQGGTLFLDEVGELPVGMQAKLLRFLEQKEVQRLGNSETVRVDVRVIAATNADLPRRVERGSFREDLYYRLSSFPLQLPSLGERVQDIVPLAEHFLQSLTESGEAIPQLTAEARRLLQSQVWKGNVRELRQVIERALILAEGDRRIGPEHLHFALCPERTLGAPTTGRPC